MAERTPTRDEACVAFLRWALPRRGFHWPGFRKVRRQVCRRLDRRIAALGLADLAAYRSYLESHATEWSAFDACCRVTISRFYRDRGVWEALAHRILPELARRAVAEERPLRAWSAGCGAGEEPHTLRLVHDASPPGAAELEILGTDVDAHQLERARRAVYPVSALRDLPEPLRAMGFEAADEGLFRLRPRFRRGLVLARQDLRRELPAGRFDLVLCRNLVFTYLDAATRRRVLAALGTRLAPGGVLVVGAHEAPPAGAEGAWTRVVPGRPLFRPEAAAPS